MLMRTGRLIGIVQQKRQIIIKRKLKRKNNMKLILLYVLIVCVIMNLNGHDLVEIEQGEQPNHLVPVYPFIDENGVDLFQKTYFRFVLKLD